MLNDPPDIRLVRTLVGRDGPAGLPAPVVAAMRRMTPGSWSRYLPELLSALRAAEISVEDQSPETMARWATCAHMIAVLSGPKRVMPHVSSRRTGIAIFEAGYREARLINLLSAQGTRHLQECARLARILAANGGVPLDLRPILTLVLCDSDDAAAERARLSIAQSYFAAADHDSAATKTTTESP